MIDKLLNFIIGQFSANWKKDNFTLSTNLAITILPYLRRQNYKSMQQLLQMLQNPGCNLSHQSTKFCKNWIVIHRMCAQSNTNFRVMLWREKKIDREGWWCTCSCTQCISHLPNLLFIFSNSLPWELNYIIGEDAKRTWTSEKKKCKDRKKWENLDLRDAGEKVASACAPLDSRGLQVVVFLLLV